MDFSAPLSPLFAFALLGIILGLIAIDCQRDIRQLVSARNAFLLTILAWYVTEAVLVPEEIWSYTQDHYDLGLLLTAGCVLGFLAGYNLTRGGAFNGTFRRLAAVDSPRLVWGLFCIAIVVGFLPLVIFSSGNPLVILEDAFVPRARFSSVFQRGRYGGVRDAILELQMFLRAAIPLAAAVMSERRLSNARRLGATLFLVFMCARAYNSGTRSQVIEVFLPVCAAAYWRMSEAAKRRAIVVGLPSMMVLGMVWSAATVIGRNQGEVDWKNASDAKYVGFEMFRELLFISNVVPELSDYRYGYTYFVQAVNPIPRAIWPGKPDGDAGLLLAEMQGAGSGALASLTVSPGLIGEMYWNFGSFGILACSFFLGYLAKSWDSIREFAKKSLLAFVVFAAGLAIIFLSGRSINMATLYGMLALYAVLFYYTSGRRLPSLTAREAPRPPAPLLNDPPPHARRPR